MSGHTPGPWEYHYSRSESVANEWIIGGPGFDPIFAFVNSDEDRPMEGATVEANARLIAAAPDLLAAVKLAFEYTPFHADACNGVVEYEEGVIFDTTRDCDCFIAKMRAAIAKAEGRS